MAPSSPLTTSLKELELGQAIAESLQHAVVTGTDVAQIEGGRIRTIHVFVDPPK